MNHTRHFVFSIKVSSKAIKRLPNQKYQQSHRNWVRIFDEGFKTIIIWDDRLLYLPTGYIIHIVKPNPLNSGLEAHHFL